MEGYLHCSRSWWYMQTVKADERIACNHLAFLSSLPLTMRSVARTGVLVAIGGCRVNCPRAVQEAARALHTQLQRKARAGSASATAAAIASRGAQGAPVASGGAAFAAAAGAAAGSRPASGAVPPPAAAGKNAAERAAQHEALDARKEAAASSLPPLRADERAREKKPVGVAKVSEQGLIEELDEAVLGQLPPDVVRVVQRYDSLGRCRLILDGAH